MLRWAAAWILAAAASVAVAKADVPPFFATITDVTSANSLIASRPDGSSLQISLAFIALPIPPQPYAQEAHSVLRAALLGQRVSVRRVGDAQDDYVLALVYRGTTNVNLALVQHGHAWVDYTHLAHPQWNVMQHRAMAQGIGLFADSNAIHPRMWRQELEAAGQLVSSAQRMLSDPTLAEVLAETYLGHRDERIFVPLRCVDAWAVWPPRSRVPITSVAGGEAMGYQRRDCRPSVGR